MNDPYNNSEIAAEMVDKVVENPHVPAVNLLRETYRQIESRNAKQRQMDDLRFYIKTQIEYHDRVTDKAISAFIELQQHELEGFWCVTEAISEPKNRMQVLQNICIALENGDEAHAGKTLLNAIRRYMVPYIMRRYEAGDFA